MPYPPVPEERRKRGIGLSLDDVTARRIEALAGGRGKRSEFIRDTLVIGLVERFGPEWETLADRRIVTDTDLRIA